MLVREQLDDLLDTSLSSNVQAKIALHLERHGGFEMESLQTEALITLILHEARTNTLRAWTSSLAKTALVLLFTHLALGRAAALAGALPLFVAIHWMRMRRGHVRRALALAAARDRTRGLAEPLDGG